jgi:hypothetical protein
MAKPSAVREHAAHALDVLLGNLLGCTELTLSLRTLLGQDMSKMRLTTLEPTVRFGTEPLRGPAIGLHLWHVFLLDLYSPNRFCQKPVRRPRSFGQTDAPGALCDEAYLPSFARS